MTTNTSTPSAPDADIEKQPENKTFEQSFIDTLVELLAYAQSGQMAALAVVAAVSVTDKVNPGTLEGLHVKTTTIVHQIPLSLLIGEVSAMHMGLCGDLHIERNNKKD